MIMKRWSLTTLFLSLFISLVLLISKPWGFTINNWFAWSISNAVFVFIFIFFRTNKFSYWYINNKSDWMIAYLQGVLIGTIFRAFLSVPYLVIVSLIMLILINAYFKQNDDYKKTYTNNRWLSYIIYFYALIIYSSHSLGQLPYLWHKEALDVFLYTPSIYFAGAASIVLLLFILYLSLFFGGFLIWCLFEEFQEEKFKEALYNFFVYLFIIVAIAITVVGIPLYIIYKSIKWGTKKYPEFKTWLIPSH